MNARRLLPTMLVSVCALVGLLALAATSAEALVSHRYIPDISAKFNEGVPAEGPHGEKVPLPGPLVLASSSMTIEDGLLWLAEPAPGGNEGRIDSFSLATGAFNSQLTHSKAFTGERGIAVGRGAGETNFYVGGSTTVSVLEESGTLKGTWTGAATPAGSFGEIADVAVDDSSSLSDEHRSDVFVSVAGQGVIDIFHPEADGKEHYVGQISSTSLGEPFSPFKFAVNDANGDIVVNDAETLDILEPAPLGEYTLASKITATPGGPLQELWDVAVDSSDGEIYATEGFGPVAVDEFDAEGDYLGRFLGTDTPHGDIQDVYSFAVDPESHDVYVADNRSDPSSVLDAFGPDVVIPDVATDPPSSVTRASATFNGTVDPDNAGPATCRFEWGTSKTFGDVAPCEPEAVPNGAVAVAVHSAALTGLEPDTTYFYRLQATNGNGTNAGEASQDQEFTTPGPRIDEESTSDVASTSATLQATINPHGVPTTYYFQYGPSSSYGTDVPAAPGEAIGSGEADVQVLPHHIQGLNAGTVYHYRVVAISEPQSGVFEEYDGPDATFTTQTVAISVLPDGRQWEMVSPPDKKGSQVRRISSASVLQAAADGSRFTYLTNAPTEAEPQGNANEVQVLSVRGPEGWTTHDIANPLSSPPGFAEASGEEFRFFSEDLTQGILQPFGSFIPQLSPEASEQTAYLTTLQCSSSCYRPLVTGKPGYANVPPGTVFGGEVPCISVICGALFLDATPDLSHDIVTSSAALTPAAVGSTPEQLYEWVEGRLTLISVLPHGGGPAINPYLGRRDYTAENAISSDGSRIVWEGVSPSTDSEALYMYDAERGESVELDSAEPGCVAEGKCESGDATFEFASANDSTVYFIDSRPLTKSSGKAGTKDLYKCEMIEVAGGGLECKLTDLTPATPAPFGEVNSAEVLGVIGTSSDGSYVYFVANGVLAEGAVPGTCEAGEAATARCNLYVSHDGTTKWIAALSAEDAQTWRGGADQTSRVSPNGNWLAFMSHASLTGYDNHDAHTGAPDTEVFLYDASTEHLTCASCNPTGARPDGVDGSTLTISNVGAPIGLLQGGGGIAASVPGWTGFERGIRHQPRYLSNSGRLFFNSNEALVPQDVNGTWDVYEYEPPGVGGCTTEGTFSERSGGCVGLISAGTSPEESAFVDASESGGDVFFMTYSRLVSQDYDTSDDMYDAHECTGSSPCFPVQLPQPPACTTAEACRAAPTPQPAIFGAPTSATFEGVGNVTSSETGGTPKAKVLTRAEKLTKAIKACKSKPKKKRAGCEKRAKAQYGSTKPRKAASKKGDK